jgi:hypothetical protein
METAGERAAEARALGGRAEAEVAAKARASRERAVVAVMERGLGRRIAMW